MRGKTAKRLRSGLNIRDRVYLEGSHPPYYVMQNDVPMRIKGVPVRLAGCGRKAIKLVKKAYKYKVAL